MSGDDFLVELEGQLGEFRLESRLSVPATGVTALVGPSGCGKTTLLRGIAGLTRLRGTVSFRDEPWQAAGRFQPPHRRSIGYVFQEPSLLPHLSVRKNLMFGLKRTKEPVRIAFDEVVGLLDLNPLLKRSASKLSGGERQRVAIGRALLTQPRLLLMDEPLSSLDVAGKAEVLAHLERLFRTLALPVLYVSHDPAEVARLADRVLGMREGRITGPAAGNGQAEAARALLAGMDRDRIEQLAAAALIAGLSPGDGSGR